MGNGDAAKNKAAFDLLFSHRGEIEQQLGVQLTWERANQCKASGLSYSLPGVSVTNEANWPRTARFHAQWSDQLCRTLLLYLQDTDELTERLMEIAGFLREWAISRDGVRENLAKCSRTYTRFTTPGMTKILPDIPGAPSGWGTENHYFYEITNRTGKAVYIQLWISSKNITPEFRQLCDRINEFYPAKFGKEDWQWRAPFRTSTISLEDTFSKEILFAGLDERMKEILAFEDDLSRKLHLS